MNPKIPKRDDQLYKNELAPRVELARLIEKATGKKSIVDPFAGLQMYRVSAPGKPIHSIYKPSLCIIAQGSKEFFLNNERYVYDPANYLIITAELPLVGHVTNASKEAPYLGLRLDLEPSLVGEVIAEASNSSVHNNSDLRAINVSTLNNDFLDAIIRLVRLIDNPSEASFMRPIITKEIIYRLWTGEQRDRLLHIVNSDGNVPLIARALGKINAEFNQQLSVEAIARDLGMSVSGFHHHFKAVTAMSPIQYQKRLRLQEARRLLLVGGLNATDAAFSVGYHDSSHFSREYKGLFGLPPKQDINRLRESI